VSYLETVFVVVVVVIDLLLWLWDLAKFVCIWKNSFTCVFTWPNDFYFKLTLRNKRWQL